MGRIVVYTSDQRGAGTDANVYIAIRGSKASINTTRLENHASNFERGSRDEFIVQSQEIGGVEEIELWHDGAGARGAWDGVDVVWR